MRTTLDIDADILQLAKEIAGKERRSAGIVISELARAGYRAAASARMSAAKRTKNGIEMLPSRGETVTLDHVRRLMDEGGA